MASLNKVLLIGNLTRDPEIRYTSSGTALCALGLAVNRRYTNSKGEDHEDTCFVEIDVWGRQAENCNSYLSKGAPVFIEGRLRFDQWDDRETGRKRSRLTVTAERVQFLGSPKRGSEFEDGPAEYRDSAPRRPPSSYSTAEPPPARMSSPTPPPFPKDADNEPSSVAKEAFADDDDEAIDDIPF